MCVFEVNSSGASGTACCIAWSIRASSAAKRWNWICLTRAAKPNRPSATSKTAGKHAWAFAPRFRRGAFDWRSEPAIARIKEAMVEIKAISKKDVLLAAEGAVLFLQKASPALPNIDSSSGAIGSAVTRAIDVLVPIIAKAPADMPTRRKWLEQLYQAHADDAIPYIESLGNYWGKLCAAPDLAGELADRLLDSVDIVWSRSREEYRFFHAATMCLSALLVAGRYELLLALLNKCLSPFWSYRQWGVKALVAMGRKTEGLRYAEASRGLNQPLGQIAEACESILLSSGLADETYQRYAFDASRRVRTSRSFARSAGSTRTRNRKSSWRIWSPARRATKGNGSPPPKTPSYTTWR